MSELPKDVLQEVLAALRRRQLIEAIKIYRATVLCSLADAKREVEALRSRLFSGEFGSDELPEQDEQAAVSGDYTPPSVDKSAGCFGVLLMGVVSVAAGIWTIYQ